MIIHALLYEERTTNSFQIINQLITPGDSMSLTGVVGDVILFGSLCIMFRRYHSRLAGFAFVLDGFCPSK